MVELLACKPTGLLPIKDHTHAVDNVNNTNTDIDWLRLFPIDIECCAAIIRNGLTELLSTKVANATGQTAPSGSQQRGISVHVEC